MYCGHCGDEQFDGQFCRSCGRPLDEVRGTNRIASQASDPQLADPWNMGGTAEVAHRPARELVGAVAGPGTRTSGSHQVESSTNVTVNVAGPQIIYQDNAGQGLLVRGLWFVCFGWYLGFFWILLAWALNTTIIGLPLGLMMFNAVPKVMTLKSRSTTLSLVANADGTHTLTRHHVAQHPLWLRALYFLLVGWWFSLAWAMLAYTIGLLVITLPISFMMFDRMPAVTTLARY